MVRESDMEPKHEHDTEQRIRMKAYELWLLEGRPEGREARHWEMAKEFIAREETRAELLAINREVGDIEDNTTADALDQRPDTIKTTHKPAKAATGKTPGNRAA